MNEAPVRMPDANPLQFQHPLPNAGVQQQQSSDNVAVKAMETVANQNPQLINIAIDAVSRAADIVARTQTPPAKTEHAPTIDDEIDRELRRAMLRKFLEPPPPPPPPPDTFAMFLKFKELMGAPASNGVRETLELIGTLKESGIVGGAVTGRTTLLDLGREFIPVLGTTVRETMHEYRLATEANARIVELQRGQQQPAAPQPIQQTPAALPAAAPNPAPQPAAVPMQQEKPSFQWIAARIARIVKNLEFPVDEAVDRVIAFLYDTDETLVGLLLDPPKLDPRLAAGKQGLLQLFQVENSLRECLVNTPRVSDFIDKFLIAGTEVESAEARLR